MPDGHRRPQHDPRVYGVLREEGDDLVVLYDTADEPVLDLRRHGVTKPVLVVATRFYVYLFKVKGMKLYRRWAIRDVSVDSNNDVVCISGSDAPAREKLEYHASARRVGGGDGGSESSEEDEVALQKAAMEGLLAPEKALLRAKEKFLTVFLSAHSSPSARSISQLLSAVIDESRQELWKVEQQEMGLSKRASKQVKFVQPQQAANDDGDSSDEELLRNVQRGGAQHGGGGRAWAKTATDAKGGALDGRSSMEEASAALWRQGALASIVDSDSVDYGVLRQAFQRRQDKALLADIRHYVEENDERMQVLSQEHYRSFLNAARLCDDIKTEDALLVQGELSGAMQLVTHAAQEMRTSAAHLVVASSTKANMICTSLVLQKLSRAASMLETTELLLQRERYLSAIRTSTELCAFISGNGLSNQLLGHYILHVRSPMIQQEVTRATLAQANRWLKGLRSGAPALGESALVSAFTRSVRGTQIATNNPKGCRRRSVVRSTQRPEMWALVDQFIPATSEEDNTMTASGTLPSNGFGVDPNHFKDDPTHDGGGGPPADGAEALGFDARAAMEEAMSMGPAIQEVFSGCGLGESFATYYYQSRTKQMALDTERSAGGGGEPQLQFVLQQALLGEVTSLVGGNAEGMMQSPTSMIEFEAAKRAFSDVARYLSTCCGIMLMEDLVHHTTSPPVQSSMDIARSWDIVCGRVADCIQDAGSSLIAAGSMRMVDMMIGGAGGDPSGYLLEKGSIIEASIGCLLTVARSFCDVVVHGVRSVVLDVLPIQRVIEGIICKLHSQWLQEYSLAISNTLAEDTLAPLVITNENEFNKLLVPHNLHLLGRVRLGTSKAPLLLPVPSVHKAGHLYLPFTISVPKVSMLARRFLEKCIYLLGEGPLNCAAGDTRVEGASSSSSTGKRGSITTASSTQLIEVVGVQIRDVLGVSGGVGAGVASRSADSFELNNIDSMMLEYVGVLFKTAHGVLQSRVQVLKEKTSSLLQLAMLASTSLAMGLVVSVSEQQFALWWQGSAGETFSSVEAVLEALRSHQGDASSTSATATIHEGFRPLGSAALLEANLSKFLSLSDACVGAMSQCLVSNIDELIAPMGKLSYYRKKLPSTSVFSALNFTRKDSSASFAIDKKGLAAKGAAKQPTIAESEEGIDDSWDIDVTASALATAVEYANGSLTKLVAILPTSILHSTAQMLVMHVSERLMTLASEALTSYQGREIGMIRQCVAVFEEENTPVVAKWLVHLNNAYPAPTTSSSSSSSGDATKPSYTFPFTIGMVSDGVRSWASIRETHWAEVSAQEMILKAGLETAGKAVIHGVQTVGTATKRGFFGFGKKVISGADATTKFVSGGLGMGGDGGKNGNAVTPSTSVPTTPRESSVFTPSTPPQAPLKANPPPPASSHVDPKGALPSAVTTVVPVPVATLAPSKTEEGPAVPKKTVMHRRKQ